MGSSLSFQSRDKRGRSNRLSKPPQNQATLSSPISRSPHQPAEQALSLPSTPTAWQNPWTSISVPAGPDDTAPPGVRSQSFSSGPLRRQTTWNLNEAPVTQRSTHTTADVWPLSPTSPVLPSGRRGSLYGRASFHPATTATFQPTTLQSNPQSPLIGPPKRSYSVHSPSQKSKNGVQRRTLDRFASFNSQSRVNGQDLPIRRRSLLMRPGVATRTEAKDAPPTFVSGPCHSSIVSPDPHHVRDSSRPPFLTHENVMLSAIEPFPQLRPPTPSDFGYTHLGALKLGSLRVVNGSASPCSSDRTRLGHASSPAPEPNFDNRDSTNLLCPVEIGGCVSRPMSPSGLNVCANYRPIIINSTGLEYIVGNQHSESDPSGGASCRRNAPSRNDIPATMLNIPPVSAARDNVDFPASPFSFEKSPTLTIGHRMTGLPETGDEGISVGDKEIGPGSVPAKIPERHLSYSSCASSHRKVDSGYSSATSHRTSIDSHASLRRSPGFRRFILGGSSRDTEPCESETPSKIGNQLPMDRHLSLHGQKPFVHNRPTSMSGVQWRRPQVQANGRLRGSSLPVSGSSGCTFSSPLYCAQLRSINSATSDLPSSITTTQINPSGVEEIKLCVGDESHDSLYTNSAIYPASMNCHFECDAHSVPCIDGHTAGSPSGQPALRNPHQSSAQAWGANSEDNATEPPRGRTRS
ncbi:hypothetical protein BDV12DRAFT_185648 [Aspergillus spectabilis]